MNRSDIMTLDELFSVLSDSMQVRIVRDGRTIAHYDGRDSIDPAFNSKTIRQLNVSYGASTLDVELEEE